LGANSCTKLLRYWGPNLGTKFTAIFNTKLDAKFITIITTKFTAIFDAKLDAKFTAIIITIFEYATIWCTIFIAIFIAI